MTVTNRVLHQIAEVWNQYDEPEPLCVLEEVHLCSFLYDALVNEGFLEEMEFNPNTFYGNEDGNYFTIPILRRNSIDSLISFVTS